MPLNFGGMARGASAMLPRGTPQQKPGLGPSPMMGNKLSAMAAQRPLGVAAQGPMMGQQQMTARPSVVRPSIDEQMAAMGPDQRMQAQTKLDAMSGVPMPMGAQDLDGGAQRLPGQMGLGPSANVMQRMPQVRRPQARPAY